MHMALWHLTGDTDMTNLIGKTIMLRTKDADKDWEGNVVPGMPTQYGSGFPRPFDVQLVEGGPYVLSQPLPNEFKLAEVLCNDGASGGQATPPQNIVTPQPQPQPVAQPQPAAQLAQQVQTTAQPAMVQQQGVQPMQPAIPAGMDPQVAAAMQNMGATNIQPVTGSVYDEQIPF